MALLSLWLDAFWCNSPYQFPLVLIPSVLVGDSIFLPILNYRIYASLDTTRRQSTRKFILLCLLTGLLLSLLLNTYSHTLWIKDSFTGFMDIVPGRLSIAGWWHYIFSVLQSTIIFSFAIYWLNVARNLSRPQSKSFEITWLVFILFNTLNIPGFLIKDLFIFRQMSLVQALHHEWTAFMPLVFSILFWLLVRLIKRASPKQYSTRSHYEQNQ
jgi:hypothetical protein